MSQQTITVRSHSTAPTVTFKRAFGGETIEGQVKIVIEGWTNATGLAFDRMPREVHEQHDEDGVVNIVVKVQHPLSNRGDVILFWIKD